MAMTEHRWLPLAEIFVYHILSIAIAPHTLRCLFSNTRAVLQAGATSNGNPYIHLEIRSLEVDGEPSIANRVAEVCCVILYQCVYI